MRACPIESAAERSQRRKWLGSCPLMWLPHLAWCVGCPCLQYCLGWQPEDRGGGEASQKLPPFVDQWWQKPSGRQLQWRKRRDEGGRQVVGGRQWKKKPASLYCMISRELAERERQRWKGGGDRKRDAGRTKRLGWSWSAASASACISLSLPASFSLQPLSLSHCRFTTGLADEGAGLLFHLFASCLPSSFISPSPPL